jgi:hypothetical protein
MGALMKFFREYDFGKGVKIRPRLEVGGVFRAMGDTEVFDIKVFDLFVGSKLIDTLESWEEAKSAAEQEKKTID